MSTITAILEIHKDGSLHLPLPPGLGPGRIKVVAKLEEAREEASHAVAATGESPLRALKELRKLGTFSGVSDPVAWQREQRLDRPL